MISICMIVRDEEENLRKTLESVKNLGYEIVIVDTGSADNSRGVALEYTDKVFNYEWNNNFSDARNFSISKAKNDIVLILDADEDITHIDKEQLEKLITENKESVGRIQHRKNEYTRNGESYVFNEYVNRIFDKRYFEYEGSIHEQIVSRTKKEYAVY